MRVTDYLRDAQVGFEVIPHPDTYDAQRMAETLHVSGRDVAKTVLIRADHGYAYIVAVLPANKRIDFSKASEVLGGSYLELATEIEIREHCPDCEIGALPPFGSKYGMQTLVDDSLAQQGEIIFESNSHHESIRMRFEDFRRLEEPAITSFATDEQPIP